MIALAKRNLLIFFRDKMNVFFSLLGVMIIILLYILFLGDVMRKGYPEMEGVRFLMDSWIMAGTLAVGTLSTTLGAMSYIVSDRTSKVDRDFAASPISRRSLALGHFLGAMVIGGILSLLSLAMAEGYILLGGGEVLPPLQLLKLLGTLLLSLLSSGSMAFLLVSFFRSQNAFASASVAVSSMTGFFTAIYLPIGQLPGPVQWIVRLFPVSHTAALMREIMMKVPTEATFAGAPPEALAEFQEELGVVYHYGTAVLPAWGSVLVLCGTAALCFGFGFWNFTRKRK